MWEIQAKSWSDWDEMGQIQDYLRSVFNRLYLDSGTLGFVPFGANLTYFESKSNTPDLRLIRTTGIADLAQT